MFSPTKRFQRWLGSTFDVHACALRGALDLFRAPRSKSADLVHAQREYNRSRRAVPRASTSDAHFGFESAAVLLLSGDRRGYAKVCARMIEENVKPGAPRPYHIARACTLAPDAVADVALPGSLAESELKSSAGVFWSLTEQGALAYRAGRFDEAARLFEQSLKANDGPRAAVVNWVWLALANQRLGKPEEARRWLNKARVWLDQYNGGVPVDAETKLGLHLHNWLEANVLRREAEELIKPNARLGSSYAAPSGDPTNGPQIRRP
jgi:tetratricopeptide (TPR) repeat protein